MACSTSPESEPPCSFPGAGTFLDCSEDCWPGSARSRSSVSRHGSSLDRVGVFEAASVYRLAQPIGYWNGLAIFAGMGALLAVTFASRSRSVIVRAVCAAALVLLLPTFYFTFGRGDGSPLPPGLWPP